jgi:hypothetical protein
MGSIKPKGKSKGFGDTIAKITHATGLNKVAEAVARAAGHEDCGCGRRQDKLNDWFPYKVETKPQPKAPVSPLIKFEGNYEVLEPIRFILADGNPITLEVGSILPIDKDHPLYKDVEYYNDNRIIKQIKDE